MRVRLIVFSILPLALPCYAEELNYESTYKYFLREGRDIIMNSCAEGKRMNIKFDASYWSSSIVDKSREEMRKTGYSENDIDTYLGADCYFMHSVSFLC